MRRTGEQQRAYLSEIAIALKRKGFTVQTEENGLLPVKWNGQPLCRINADGVVRYDSQTVSDFDLDNALAKATSVTMTVTEYMKLMEQAPDLKASGLESGFKLLGEFNDVILAGRMTRFGVNFVTWNWDRDHSSVDNGHYFMENYKGAKQDLRIHPETMLLVKDMCPKDNCFRVHLPRTGGKSGCSCQARELSGIHLPTATRTEVRSPWAVHRP